MSAYVVDAGVAVKWILDEPHSDAARRLEGAGHILLAPDFLFVEVGNVLWKRVQANSLTADEAQRLLRALATAPLSLRAAHLLVADALDLACRHARTVFDSLYVALAVHEGAQLVTADRRLFNALQSGPLASYLQWVGDL